jgi:putative flippase GtrA
MQDKKQAANEVIRYLIFGVLTTAVYFVVRFLSLHLGLSNMVAMTFAQSISILFAFITNKLFVFMDDSKDKNIFLQLLVFIGARLSGVVVDALITFLCIDQGAHFFIRTFGLNSLDYSQGIFALPLVSGFIGSAELVNSFFWTMVIQVIIIVMNYLISKFIVFSKK